ncbi:MAG: hypothetical protein CMK59_13485 [Proteobacteria bacterium]|nr:hypothetical protein [Pseudomonadota bacterium]
MSCSSSNKNNTTDFEQDLPSEQSDDSSTSISVSDTSNNTDTMGGSWSFGEDTVTLEVQEHDSLRSYTLSSTHPQRDNGPSERSFSENSGDPILRSGNILTDALFAMAVQEAKENAVENIQDNAFSSSQSCSCFETGELWNWVWTRDIAYATELGLAWFDTERAKNSLLFKVSQEKTGGLLQIVQDTGTGGSWPISTDRVTWARGAMSVLEHSDDNYFKSTVIEALRNTAEQDKKYVFDSRDGLYFGETSFLDWREQTYPSWMQNNPALIGMSKSLSTNLNHLFLLRSLESLTGEDHSAQALAEAIDANFWNGQYYSSFKTTELQPVVTHQQDLLATALAIIDLGTHPEALAQYPHSTVGAPVIFPQQQLTPIYHNRAIWPFVSAYTILAARKANNQAVFDANLNTLIRGAALNISNMENLEWQTGKNWVEDGAYSGPIVNSRRQLWSVAGFLGAIVHGVFGLSKENGLWYADPVLPNNWFSQDATLSINGQTFTLGNIQMDEGQITYADESDWRNLYSAAIPSVELSGSEDNVNLSISTDESAGINIYKNGELIAQNASLSWNDTSSTTNCYSAAAILTHPSHVSAPTCWWGDDYARIKNISIEQFNVVGGTFSNTHGRPHYDNWGAQDHQMSTTFSPNHSGLHYLQLVYGNGSNNIDTGITAAVKWMSITNSNGVVVGSGGISMPQLGSWDIWGDSTLLPIELNADETYTLTISDGWNMSYLEHYKNYVFAGGTQEPYNYVNISELKVLFIQ